MAWAAVATVAGRLHGKKVGVRYDPETPILRRLGAWYAHQSRRWQGVRLTCRDALDLFPEAGGWSVYADPPYCASSGSSYLHDTDRDKLRRLLAAHDGPVLLAGYDMPDGWWSAASAPKTKRVLGQSLNQELIGSPHPLVPAQGVLL